MATRIAESSASVPTLTATCSYGVFGDPKDIDYSDDTPDVSSTLDRLGRPLTITDGSGTRDLTYHATTGKLDLVSYGTTGALANLSVDYSFDGYGRSTGYAATGLGTVTWNYDGTSGALTSIGDGSSSHEMDWAADGMLRSVLTKSGATSLFTRRLNRDPLGQIYGSETFTPSGTVLARHGYRFDAAGRRTQAIRENGENWQYAYDTKGQVTSGQKYFRDGQPMPGHDFDYAYDTIGNRTTVLQGGTNMGVTYVANNLNQYTQVTTGPGRIVMGVTSSAPPAPTINGLAPDYTHSLGFYSKYLGATGDNDSAALWTNDSVSRSGVTISGKTWTPKKVVSPSYDYQGNLTEDGRWKYFWDAENRLKSMETSAIAVSAGVPNEKLEFTYDSQSRRVAKTVSTWNGSSWVFGSNQRFLYDDWNLIGEYTAPSATSTSLTADLAHVWGIDLSNTPQGAGGVGGLLGCKEISGLYYYPCYDGNGNVSAWVGSPTGNAVLERREYSPFGQLIGQYKLNAIYAIAKLPKLRFGFSTKYTDKEVCFTMDIDTTIQWQGGGHRGIRLGKKGEIIPTV